MVQRNDDPGPIDRDLGPESDDEDDLLGEAIEEYLALAERDEAPDLEEFLARHEDLKDELRAALEGLELVHGLVGRAGGGSGSWGSSPGGGSARWLESGHRIAGYRIVRELGRGGMGTVYEAVHVGLDRPVALKVLGTHAAPDSSARRRFLNEAKTAAGLHHTHIVPVFDVGQVGGLCYYAMQRIEGSGLDRVVRHLRRSRPPAVGPAGASSLADGPAAPGSSSFGSRFGHIWLRVSPGWLWRPSRPGPPDRKGAGAHAPGGPDRPGAAASQARPGIDGRGLLPPMPGGDSTASWGSRRIERRDGRAPGAASQPDHLPEATGSFFGMAGPPGLTAPEATGRGDAPPPFEPPRGSAYFRWVASVGLQAADALAHAHHQGVIHRDVKPSNLLIDAGGNIWVTDFGLARRLADPGLTHHDHMLGTPRYMSPEQARTAGQVDARTDVYSLGATLYELLTLRPPFDGQSAAELVDQIGRDEPVPPRKYEPRIPRDLETIVLKALAKRPADRYASAGELAEDLARFLSHAPVKARRISPVGRLWRVARRHPQIAAVTTTAAAIVLATFTFAHIRVLDALKVKEHAVVSLEEANRKTLAEMRKHYLLTARILDSTDDPDRRGRGLDLIDAAVKLGLSPAERAEFRDEAVKFLVMRDVETRPGLATGHGSALTFGPQGHRLWILSEDGEVLSLWDVEQRRRLIQVPLRNEPVAEYAAPEAAAGLTAGDRPEPGQGGTPSAGRVRDRVVPPGPRRGSLAVVGNWIAVLGPDRAAITLIDPLSGTTLRRLTSTGQEFLGMVADPNGRHLVTIEQSIEDLSADLEAMIGGVEPPSQVREYRVNLWDLERLDRPKARLGRYPRLGPSGGRPPLVAIGPDGRTIAVAAFNGTFVRLYSSEDGAPRPGRGLDNQAEVTALALGPNGLMAAAGHDQIRLYDLDSPRPFVTGLKPWLTYIRLMRFSPTGALALAGPGRIELWDPAAASLVAALPGSEQAVDLAFSPDGRTLAAAGRIDVTPVWTIQDSAARTQLSGFDARTTSLAFGPEGVLAVGCSNGAVWTWQKGRCPESGSAMPVAAAGDAEPSGGPRTPAARAPAPDGEPGSAAGPGRRQAGQEARSSGRAEPSGRPHGGPMRGIPLHSADRPAALAFDSLGRLLAHDSMGLRLWPAGPHAVHEAPAAPALPRVPPMTWTPIARTPDGRIMAILRGSSVYLWRSEAPDRFVPVVPPPTAESVGPSARPAAPGADAASVTFHAIQIAPRGDRIYLLDRPGHLHVWDLAASRDGAELQASEPKRSFPPIEGLFSFALRQDGAILAVGDRAGIVTFIDTARGNVRGAITPSADESSGFAPTLAFSADGRTLAIGSQQGTIALYSVDSPERPRLRLRLPGHRGRVSNLAFDAAGTRLASAWWTDPVVEVWDLELIGRELNRLGLDH